MILSETPRIELLNMDCMEFMADCKDKQFDLAIVDPPYGIGAPNMSATPCQRKNGANRLNCGSGKLKNRTLNTSNREWDNNPPDEKYFKDLIRVSQNQIIWGGNYFNLPPSRCFLVWDKVQPWENFSQVEMAWTSFDSPALLFKFDNRTGGKIHPTQKPVKLYEWLLTNYAKPGDTILDTHGGSFSSAIAAYRLGFDFTGIELDKDYFNAAVKRFKEQTAQLDAFRQPKPATVTQLTLNPYGDKLCPNCNRHHSEAGEFCCTACEFGI